MNLKDKVREVRQTVDKQNSWRKRETINMIASENVSSPTMDEVYCSDFYHRYAEGQPFKRYYNGTKHIDKLEQLTNELARDLFNARIANIQLISGTVANLAALSMFTRPGDFILSNSTAAGGHISHNQSGAAGVLRTGVVNFPTTEDGFHIDVDGTLRLMNKKSTSLRQLTTLLFGCSLFLFPQPVKEISTKAKEHDLNVIYDAAHVLGLIAGGKFQDPLKEGADLITASTHKTFFGPQGGIMLSNMSDEEWKTKKGAIFPGVISNHHLHRIPALAIAILEFQEFGKQYAEQVCKNAKAFGEALYNKGFDVKCPDFGFTDSHQIAVNVEQFGGGKPVADKLEENNIILNKNLLPGEKITYKTLQNPSGLRIGMQEMTRWGMKEDDFRELADIFENIIKKGKNQKEKVDAFRNKFQTMHYTFR